MSTFKNVSLEPPEIMDHSVTTDGESFNVSQLNTYTPRHHKTTTKQPVKVNRRTEEIMLRNEM
jgi:hypothetical protein